MNCDAEGCERVIYHSSAAVVRSSCFKKDTEFLLIRKYKSSAVNFHGGLKTWSYNLVTIGKCGKTIFVSGQSSEVAFIY